MLKYLGISKYSKLFGRLGTLLLKIIRNCLTFQNLGFRNHSVASDVGSYFIYYFFFISISFTSVPPEIAVSVSLTSLFPNVRKAFI